MMNENELNKFYRTTKKLYGKSTDHYWIGYISALETVLQE